MRTPFEGIRARACAFRWLAVLAALTIGGSALAADQVAPAQAGAGVGKIAAVQNQVETRRRAEAGWSPAAMYQTLYELDRVRTGPGSRAAILYSDRTLHRVGEKSEIEIQAPSAGQPGILKVVSGTSYFSSRSPKDYGRIETPTVTAAIKGTEFVVEVAEDKTTKITMLEGVVEASNTYGSLTVGAGEQAYVEPGKAPQKRIVVHPRDAVAWALDYPPVLGGSDAQKLGAMGAPGQDLSKAAELLSQGKVEEATPLIRSAREARPNDPVALALASVVEVTQNRRDEAMTLAEQAVAADPNSAAAALSLSFAAQAKFDIARARAMAEKAATLDPTNALALARAAELRMAEGDLGGARRAAEEAVKRSPGEPRALSVLGFVELAQYRSKEAEVYFERAAAADPSFSMGRLGLGIARIRRGKVEAGREELQAATALDPDDSLLRSYLGKALYEEKRTKDAGKEFAAAKALDPNDPTPWLYDAILKQNDNRPVEALEDLHESMRLNDNRAVYRSRMLLDEDRAVRGSDLARVYNDLGFDQLGLVTARRSADESQSNFSSHLFLSGGYRALPGYAPAFFSEVLQARIYQPVSVNAVRPDVVNESVSFNEYTALFDRPRLRLFAGLGGGGTATNLDGFVLGSAFFQNYLDIKSSVLQAKEATATLNGDRYAAAVSYSGYQDEGFRLNSDREVDNYRAFLEFAAGYRDMFQINLQRGLQYSGDLPLHYNPLTLSQDRLETRLWNAGAGYHHIFAPGSDLAVSFIYNATRQTGQHFSCDFTADFNCIPVLQPGEGGAILRGPQLEAQQVLRGSWTTWVLGAGAFRGTTSLEATGAETMSLDDEFTNAYAYVTLRPHPSVDVTMGAAGESVLAPTGLLLERGTGIVPSDLAYDKSKFSPKLGVTWRPWATTTVRAAGYQRLSPALGRLQTLEPTQVAGFNQFFRVPGGTWTTAYGVGIDQTIGSRMFAGISYLHRNMDIPEAWCDNPSSFSACRGQQATNVDMKSSRNVDASAYFNAILSKRLTFAFEGAYLEKNFDYTQYNGPYYEDYASTWRLRPGLRALPAQRFLRGRRRHVLRSDRARVRELRFARPGQPP